MGVTYLIGEVVRFRAFGQSLTGTVVDAFACSIASEDCTRYPVKIRYGKGNRVTWVHPENIESVSSLA
jgi:hypothetical protein